MAFIPKTWRDRDSEFPNRRIITHADSTEEQVLVRRDEGEVRVEGDPFAAANMNNLESRIVAGITSSVTTDTYNALDTVDKSVIGAINEVSGEKNLAEQYDMAETYAVGDYVIYETVLYKCIIGTTGGFDTDCWERVLVTDEMGHGGGASALDDLTDVSIIAPTVGQALVYNGTGWENDDVSGGSSSLSELSDVVISSPSDKQGLVYDAQSGKWINGSSAGFALEKTASGAVVSFNDGADDLPVKSCVVSFMASQASGTPSPSNPLPITLVSSVSTTRTGKNLCPVSNIVGATWANTNSSLLAFMNSLVNGRYTLSMSLEVKTVTQEASVWVWGFVVISSGNIDFKQTVNSAPTVGQKVNNSITFEINDTNRGKFTAFYVYGCGNNTLGAVGSADFSNIQFEVGSTASAYEAYSGTTYTTALSAPSAGGWKDMASGDEGTTHGFITFNGQESWSYSTSGGQARVYSNISDAVYENTNDIMSNIIKPVASAGGSYPPVNEGYINMNGYIMIGVDPSTITSADAWKTFLASQNMQLVYPLATPTTASGTGNNITTLKGQNVVFSDVGDTDLTYQTEQASDIIDLVGEGGASDLADLGDVDLTTPTDGQVLTYDATAEKWVNEDVVGTHVVVEKTVLGSVPVKPSSISTLTVTDAMGTDCVKVKQYLECAQIDAPRYDPPREDLGTIQAVSFAHLRHIHNGTTDTYNTSFSTSFFGGEYDFISGTVKVTLDAMSIQTCTMHNTYPSLFAKAIDSKFVQSISAFIKSSIYTLTKGVLQLNAVKDHEIIIYNGDWNGTTRLWAVWKDTRFTTNSQMTTWLADDHQITLVGLLQTPYYLQATAHAIALDEGENTFESYDMLEFGARIELTYISDDAESIIDEFQAQTGIEDLNDTQILNPSNNQALLYDSTSGKWQNKVIPVPWVEVTGTLVAGNTTLTLSDSAILTTSTIEVSVWDSGEKPTAIAVQTGSVTLTFDAQQSNLNVKVRIS